MTVSNYMYRNRRAHTDATALINVLPELLVCNDEEERYAMMFVVNKILYFIYFMWEKFSSMIDLGEYQF